MGKAQIVSLVCLLITWAVVIAGFMQNLKTRRLIREARAMQDPLLVFTGLGIALEESVKLQSHYAGLLNIYDGGERMQFASAKEWTDRLRVTGTIPKGLL